MAKKIILYSLVLCLICCSFFGCNNAIVDKPLKQAEERDLTKEKVEQILSEMTLEEKIYQMMFVTPESITNSENVSREIFQNELEMHPVGGIIYFAPNLISQDQTTKMIENTQKNSKIPLFIGVDEEGGKVSRLGSNKNMNFPLISPMKNIGDTGDEKKAYETGKELGVNLLRYGFNVDFAPVADVILNDNNTEIGNRSFGKDADKVSKMVENFVTGMEQTNVLSVLKHFPGHGSTTLNSHLGFSNSERTLDQIKKEELIPFKKGIDAGASFVLVSHMTLSNAVKEKVPCTLSKEIMTDLLKNELGFEGIIITDSMSMGAITTEYTQQEAIVKSINAGSDMILMPLNISNTLNIIKNAVENGDISEERINESVRKILKVKIEKLGI